MLWSGGAGERYADIAAEFVGLRCVISRTDPQHPQSKKGAIGNPDCSRTVRDPVGAGRLRVYATGRQHHTAVELSDDPAAAARNFCAGGLPSLSRLAIQVKSASQ